MLEITENVALVFIGVWYTTEIHIQPLLVVC